MVKKSFSWALKMEPARCPERPVRRYLPTLSTISIYWFVSAVSSICVLLLYWNMFRGNYWLRWIKYWFYRLYINTATVNVWYKSGLLIYVSFTESIFILSFSRVLTLLCGSWRRWTDRRVIHLLDTTDTTRTYHITSDWSYSHLQHFV